MDIKRERKKKKGAEKEALKDEITLKNGCKLNLKGIVVGAEIAE